MVSVWIWKGGKRSILDGLVYELHQLRLLQDWGENCLSLVGCRLCDPGSGHLFCSFLSSKAVVILKLGGMLEVYWSWPDSCILSDHLQSCLNLVTSLHTWWGVEQKTMLLFSKDLSGIESTHLMDLENVENVGAYSYDTP